MALSEFAVLFKDSMPEGYRSAFSDSDIEEHAQIALERGAQPARVVVWRTLPPGMAILCVITEDRPGLVALVSSAFVAHALDVRAAQIYCRRTARDQVEAVDFFWLRNVGGGLPEPSRLEACARTISELCASAGTAAPVPEPQASAGEGQSRLTFAPAPGVPEQWEVQLETRDFPGLLHTVARLLHQHGLEVARCEIRTDDGFARDRFFVASFAGAPTEPALQLFRRSLLSVIDAVGKSAG